MTETIREEKKALRSAVRKAERRMTMEARTAADRRITQRVLSLPAYRAARTVFAYVGTQREIDTREILQDVLRSGKRLCVPLCTGDGIMVPKQILSLEALHPGAYGIQEPAADAPEVPACEIDLALIPCVTCNHRGERLGQGGGYYDRFLGSCSGEEVMLCREELIREVIPRETHDLKIGCVITDAGIWRNQVHETE